MVTVSLQTPVGDASPRLPLDPPLMNTAGRGHNYRQVLNYLVNYLVWPHQQDAHRRGLGLSGSIHEEAHPIVSNFS